VVNSDGSNPRKVTDGRFITWTPDSRGLVFKGESDKPPVTVSRVNIDGSGLSKIATLNLYGNGMNFNWIPDGKSIIVSAACDPAKMDANSIQYQRCLFLLDVASGNLKKYTNPANSTVQVDSVRPDGQMVLYTDRCNTKTVSRCLYTLHVSSGKITPLTTVDIGGVNQTRISISPDWKKVGFEASLNNKTDIFSVDLASAKLTRITNGGSSFYPTWSADGVWLLYQNGSKLYAVQPGNPPLWIRTDFQIIQAVFLP
jgi:Tol biopolymer transport system component